MEAYRVDATLDADSSLRLDNLPFPARSKVEVILLEREREELEIEHNPFWGIDIEYIDPFEPVAMDDWDVLK